MNSVIKKFLNDESGATAIEYGLIAALLAVGISAAVSGLRDQINLTFNAAATKLQTATQ